MKKMPDLRSEKSYLGFGKDGLGFERHDLGSERPDLVSEMPILSLKYQFGV